MITVRITIYLISVHWKSIFKHTRYGYEVPSHTS